MSLKCETIEERETLLESRRIYIMHSKYVIDIKSRPQQNKSIIFFDETWFDTHDTSYGTCFLL